MQEVMAVRPEVAAQAAIAAAQSQAITPVEHAMRAGATPEQLQALLELQVRADNHRLDLMREQRRMAEEDRIRAAKAAFMRDLAAFRGENIIIPKSKFVDRGRAGSFMQAEYGTVAGMLSPALSRHGFSFRHDMKFGYQRRMIEGVENDVPWVYVTTYLEHREGHTEVLELDGPPGDLSANTPVQNMQATASYLKRQGVLAITGTATADEDSEGDMPKARRRQDTDDAQDADDKLVDAGRAEAMKGMAALTKWWGALTAKQRSALNGEFGAMRKCAARVDQEAGNV